jgi:hypothetical protein
MYRYRADVGLGGWEAHLYLRCELRAAGSGVAGATSLIFAFPPSSIQAAAQGSATGEQMKGLIAPAKLH